MSFHDALTSHVKRDVAKNRILHGYSNEATTIVNSFDGEIHNLTKHCEHEILTQSIGVMRKSSVIEKKRNLSKPSNLLTMFLSYGEENIKTMENLLNE